MLKVVFCIIVVSWFYSSQLLADNSEYYSEDLRSTATQSNPEAFRQALHENLAYFHIDQSSDKPDVVTKECPLNASCFKHDPLGYREARTELLGDIHLEHDGSKYFITTLYCREKLTQKDFGGGRGPAPGKVPDHRILNTEHIWPQSKFSRKFSKGVQKTDLHSLYPAVNNINGTRGSLPFGEVSSVKKDVCEGTKIGSNGKDGRTYFQPTESVRGDIARAQFYFSVRYKIQIDPVQEGFFRKWHTDDPVSEIETSKNDMVFDVQGNRNPFVDNPDWVNNIQDF